MYRSLSEGEGVFNRCGLQEIHTHSNLGNQDPNRLTKSGVSAIILSTHHTWSPISF